MTRRALVVIGALGSAVLAEALRVPAAAWWPIPRPASAAADTASAAGRREVWARADLAAPRDAYTGADIQAALRDCRPGCALRLLPEAYADVAIDIRSGFTDGQLAIVGAGKGRTVLQMSTDAPDHVIDIGPGAPDGIEVAHLTIDGRKALQRPPLVRPGVLNKTGITVSVQSGENVDGVHLHDLELKNFVNRAIMVRNSDRFVIESNEISDTGCNQRRTPCGSRLSPNPWDREPDTAPTAVDTKAIGQAIIVGGDTRNGVVRNNTAVRATKYAIGVYTNGALCGSPAESKNILIEGNTVQDSASGIVLNGGCYSTIRNNRVEGSGRGFRTCPGGCMAYHGFASGTDNEGNVFDGNVARENLGSGFHLGGSGPGGNLTIRNNQSIDNCLLGDEYTYYDYAVRYPGGFRRPYPGVVFSNNHAIHTKPTRCRWAVAFASRFDIVMDGGSYAAGTEGGVRFDDGENLEMRNTTITGSAPVGIWVGKDFRRGRVWPSVVLAGEFRRRSVNESPSLDGMRVKIDAQDGLRRVPPQPPQSPD